MGTTTEMCAILQCDDSGFSTAHSAKVAMQIEDKSDIETKNNEKENDDDEGLDDLHIVIVGSIIATMICVLAIVIFAATKCAKSPKMQIDEENENENGQVMEV